MKAILTISLLLWLCCEMGGVPTLAEESGHRDHEAPLVKDGVLGTVNVLRELDVKTGKNRVTVEGNYKFSTDWFGGPVESTIDGSAIPYNIRVASDPEIITYTLPGLRTVSSPWRSAATSRRGDKCCATSMTRSWSPICSLRSRRGTLTAMAASRV